MGPRKLGAIVAPSVLCRTLLGCAVPYSVNDKSGLIPIPEPNVTADLIRMRTKTRRRDYTGETGDRIHGQTLWAQE